MKWYVKLAIGTALGFTISEAYRHLASPEQKARWEEFIKTHHGEAGVFTTALGALTKSPTVLGMGIGLAIHDRNDASKWFK